MAGPSSISSTPLPDLLYIPEVNNQKILFYPRFDIQTADYDLLNKYVIYKFNQYIAINIEDYSFWNFIQIDFTKFEVKYFNKFNNIT